MWSPLNIVHAGLNLVRSGLEDFDESATAIVISPEMAKMVGLIFVASESAIDLLNYEHIDSGSGSSSSSYQQGDTVWEEDGELARGINVLEHLNAHMETDDNLELLCILTMHDPLILSVPEADDENRTHSEQFKVAIIKEVTDLIETTKTLTSLSANQVSRCTG